MQFLTRKGYDYSGQHEKERIKGLKKIVSVLICLLCVAGAYAVTYGSSYRGTGRSSYVATGYHSAATGLSHAPAATMRSTSSAGYSAGYARTAPAKSSMTVMPVQGLYTSASAVRGGVTTGGRKSAGAPTRKSVNSDPGVPDPPLPECGCYWYWDEESDQWKCTNCGCKYTWEELYELEGTCGCDDPCDCPIGDGADVLVMMFALALAYGIHGVWKAKKEAIEG